MFNAKIIISGKLFSFKIKNVVEETIGAINVNETNVPVRILWDKKGRQYIFPVSISCIIYDKNYQKVLKQKAEIESTAKRLLQENKQKEENS